MSETMPSGDGSEAYLTFSARLQPIEIESTSTGAGAMSDREDTLQYLNGTPFPKVKELADGGDAAMRVELGIRHYTGCGTPEDRETAKQIWEATVKDETLSDADTPSVKRALLCLCALFQESYQTTGAIDDLLDAGRFANIVLGLDADVSADGDGKGNRLARQAAPIALFTAQQLSRVRERLSGAERTAFDSQTADMLFLMDAFARRWVAIDASDGEGAQTRTAQAKPNPYECGRPGCGVVTQKLGTLRRCAGKCPAEVKPYYCSPECQKLDWKSHKLVCKPREPMLPSSTAKGMPGIGVKMPGVPLGRPLRPQPSTVPPESVKGGRDHAEQRAKDDDVD